MIAHSNYTPKRRYNLIRMYGGCAIFKTSIGGVVLLFNPHLSALFLIYAAIFCTMSGVAWLIPAHEKKINKIRTAIKFKNINRYTSRVRLNRSRAVGYRCCSNKKDNDDSGDDPDPDDCTLLILSCYKLNKNLNCIYNFAQKRVFLTCLFGLNVSCDFFVCMGVYIARKSLKEIE